tara:strand:+ start:36 stop:830 length:795 start_codon:yes stop_codon:yes gene_type:complete
MIDIEIEPWMKSIEDVYYGDECFNNDFCLVDHPHYMKYKPFADISSNKLLINKAESIRKEVTSMLHPHTLAIIRNIAKLSTGTILEIGAFTGGATISAAQGLIESGSSQRMLTVEIGSNYNDNGVLCTHDYSAHVNGLNSDNLFYKLWTNLVSFNVEHKVNIFETNFLNRNFLEYALIPYIEKNPLGLIILDSDGQVEGDLDILLPYANSGCYIMVDDYMMHSHYAGDGDKATPSQKAVHKLINSGKALSLGVYKWTTWFGYIK